MPSRYLIGIDLGTTNSVVAYIDTQETARAGSNIQVLPIPQLVGHGEVRTLSALPSFLYFPTDAEVSTGVVSATWNESPAMVTGVLAREQGALVPNRQVSSAKSWLSHPGVHRKAKILPAQAEPPQPMISPVEASARYLMHLRDAWNSTIGSDADTRFEEQETVVTVPGSFDEEARELTVEAAQRAGIKKLTLLEEPLAAFYAWIAANQHAPASASDGSNEGLADGDLILICDIGGGTTDFSLVRANSVNTEWRFERTAIGEHLLLGGDNLDFALASHVEKKLRQELTQRQRYALRRASCAAKERLLSDLPLDHVPVTILGSGHTVVGQTQSVDLTREEVLQVLMDGFLPITAPTDVPAHSRPTGLRELGLPYATDPAITKHLAAFLAQRAIAVNVGSANQRMARPSSVLFNGGFCSPAVVRERIVDAISTWFGETQSGWRPKVLNNEAVDSAVGRGAAYYGHVRRGMGLRIKAGSARTYYIGWDSEDRLEGICVLPAGAEEGTSLPLPNREFSVLANRPVSFALYSSRTRHDAHGEIVALDEADVHRYPPLVTLLRYGKKMRDVHLVVGLRASFTEVGTLELWCESRDTPHRWLMQFEVRSEEAQEQPLGSTPKLEVVPIRYSPVAASDAKVESAAQLIEVVFGDSTGGELTPENLVTQMETALDAKRDSWTILALRRFCDVLIGVAAGRKKSPRHEVRWLNLSGFCLRPGFGAPGDDARVNKLRTVAWNELVFADDLQCQAGNLSLLRRIVAGINASDQQALYRKHASRVAGKKSRVNRQLEYEQWRLIASLEHLLAGTRALLGNHLLAKIRTSPEDAIWLWSLGRLGARIPLYGPLHCVVTADTAGEWVNGLLNLSKFTPTAASALVLLARRTGDRSRDIDDAIRQEAVSLLVSLRIAEETVQLLSRYVPPDGADAVRSFGESLPPGLQAVSSSSCLLSVPALRSPNPTF